MLLCKSIQKQQEVSNKGDPLSARSVISSVSEVSDLVSGRSVISSVFVVGALGLKVSSVSEVSDFVSVPDIAIFAQGRATLTTCPHSHA